jgi:hypothetical protein
VVELTLALSGQVYRVSLPGMPPLPPPPPPPPAAKWRSGIDKFLDAIKETYDNSKHLLV